MLEYFIAPTPPLQVGPALLGPLSAAPSTPPARSSGPRAAGAEAAVRPFPQSMFRISPGSKLRMNLSVDGVKLHVTEFVNHGGRKV